MPAIQLAGMLTTRCSRWTANARQAADVVARQPRKIGQDLPAHPVFYAIYDENSPTNW
jgi:hypothetical protein